MIRNVSLACVGLQASEALETIQGVASVRGPRDAVLGGCTVASRGTLSMRLAAREALIYMPKTLSLSCARCCHVEERVSKVQVDIRRGVLEVGGRGHR